MLITLTESGRERIAAAVVDHVDLEAQLLGKLSEHDRDHLAGLLRKLLTGLGDHAPGGSAKPGT